MKAAAAGRRAEEIELKLALPVSDPSTLARRLAQTPVLAHRKSNRLQLHNIYFDTPDMLLRQQRVALRLRRLGDAPKAKWLQTLKTTGHGDSALSRRGEWEIPVGKASLSLPALIDTPWSAMDPHGTLFQALAPVFETCFERTAWLVRRRDGSVVEVALDIGQIMAGDKQTPICELELELKAGRAAALFDIALQLSNSIALLPAPASKAERGYALVQDLSGRALRARPVPLPARLPRVEMAQRVLREMFSQFTANLNTLQVSDDPEVVHQARVGWRRFKSARRLFRPVLPAQAVPSWQALQALLTCLGRLRDLDVARCETLPPLAHVYVADDAQRAEVWQGMTLTLLQAARLQRKEVLYALQEPAVGACLLATSRWLEDLSVATQADGNALEPASSLRHWTQARIVRLKNRLKAALKDAQQPDQQHRVRILAKQLRYDLEALESLLPKKLTQRWQHESSVLQERLGATRDAMRAAALVAELEVDRGLAEFLRGLCAGQQA